MYHSTSAAFIADLWDRYDYDPLRGTFISRRFNRPVPGTSSIDHRNYKRLSVTVNKGNRTVPMSYGRAVYAWMTGTLPPPGHHIDHINHDSHDNRYWNLRCVTVRENNQNRRNQGSAGIYWNKRLKKWQAQIRIQGKRKYLGIFIQEVDALERYIQECEENAFMVLPEVRERAEHLRSLQPSLVQLAP